MKIKILFFLLGAGLILASCSDKEAEAKIKQMETDMHKADSTCTADKQMMMDSMMGMQHKLDSLMMAASMRSSTTTTTTKTMVAPTTTKKMETPVKETTKKGVDIKKKPGATGGN